MTSEPEADAAQVATTANARAETKPAKRDEKVLGAAGSFTGLWALTWLASTAMGATAGVQGGFAVGGVMAGSGLTVLWWKTRALKALVPASQTSEAGARRPPKATTQPAQDP